METQEAPKRKYKKHKQGFKIAVEHKLNTRLNTYFVGDDYYPLYVEVRAKGKMNFVASRFNIYVSEQTFENFLNDPFIKVLLDEEVNQIQAEIAESIKLNSKLFNAESVGQKSEFTLAKWNNDRRNYLLSKNWIDTLHLKLSDDFIWFLRNEKKLSGTMYDREFPDEIILSTVGLIELLYLLKVDGLEELYKVSESFICLNEKFRQFERDYTDSTSCTWNGVLGIYKSFKVQELTTPVFRHYMNYIEKNTSAEGSLQESVLEVITYSNKNICQNN